VTREYYLTLAASGLSMPIGTDLVLRTKPDAESILIDGDALGRVIVEAARRFNTPLAFPHMNLELEKAVMLTMLGVPEDEVDSHKLATCPSDEDLATLREAFRPEDHPKLNGHIRSIGYVARNSDLLPIGMSIGPFSLTTKLLADPITPVYLSGTGATADDEPEIRTLERALEMSLILVLRSLEAQIEQGARAVFIAEPAANRVFFSPRQMEAGSDIFDRYAMDPNRQVKALLDARGVDLLFHCCGELTDAMVARFCDLRPVILSLGSSRRLWEDAAIVPKDIVLYGNLPSKRFYSDELMPLDEVQCNQRLGADKCSY
jgi:uroporphyrinogen-III decarboxylase